MAVEKREGWGFRVSTELDSESLAVFHKASWKVAEGVAKLWVSFQSRHSGLPVAHPRVGLVSKHVSVEFDLEDRNAQLRGSLDVGPHVQVTGTHDVNARRGDISVAAQNNGYSLQVSSPIPAVKPKAAFKCPIGELHLDDNDDDHDGSFAVDAVIKAHALGGLCSAQYSPADLNLRYAFKDQHMAFIPSLSLPSNSLSMAFKRRFSPSHKLSYWYNFDANNWSAVYKQTYGKDLKFKAGYDSEVRIAWASLWVGDENGKTKTAPLKMKLQLMLQVPQDDIKSSALMFRLKKRWDF